MQYYHNFETKGGSRKDESISILAFCLFAYFILYHIALEH